MRFERLMIPLLFLFSTGINAFALSSCASVNLGGSKTSSIYMTLSLCHNTCNDGGFAVAIVQGQDCWCSNTVPLSTASMSNCDVPCPVWPAENCASDGYYGYLVIDQNKVQTLQSSSRTSTSSTSSTSKTSSTSSTSKTSSIAALTTQTTQTSQESKTIATTIVQTQSASGDTPPQATTIVSVKTINGTQAQIIKTQFITKIPEPTSASLTSSSTSASTSAVSGESATSTATSHKKASFFDSTGKVAGTFTAVGVVVAGIVAAILYCCCCGAGRRHNDHDGFSDEENQYSSDELSLNNSKAVAASIPNSDSSSLPLRRDNSTKSLMSIFNAVTGGGGATAASAPGSAGNVLHTHNGSNDYGIGRSGSRKKLNPSKNAGDQSRNYEGMMFPITEMDSRLDPTTMFLNTNTSKKSLEDDMDYSRKMLKVVNPE